MIAAALRAPLPAAAFAAIRDQALAAGSPTAAVLAADDTRVRDRLRLLEAEHAALLAHVRAALATRQQGNPLADPLLGLYGHLEERGQLPPPDASPAALLAQADRLAGLVDELLPGGGE